MGKKWMYWLSYETGEVFDYWKPQTTLYFGTLKEVRLSLKENNKSINSIYNLDVIK